MAENTNKEKIEPKNYEKQFTEFNKEAVRDGLRNGDFGDIKIACTRCLKLDLMAVRPKETVEDYKYMEFKGKAVDKELDKEKRKLVVSNHYDFWCPVCEAKTSIFLDIYEVEEVENDKKDN